MPAWLTVERRRAIAFGLVGVLALVAAARHLAGTRAPSADTARAAAALAQPAAAPANRLFVDVVGAVRRPGLYRLPDGSRVADAVSRAGGATRRADLSLVNLAAPLADGLQVVVPRRQSGSSGAAGGSTTPAGPVHLNTATLEQLDVLPGIGPGLAQRILDHRQQIGGFGSVEELGDVPGIGEVRMAELRELVRV